METVRGEAYVSEDLCQWSGTPGRSTQTRLVEGDRPDRGQSLTLQVEGFAWDQPLLASIVFHRDRARWRTRISL